jgi:hypothetical protein
MIKSIDALFSVLRSRELTEAERLAQLARALDELAHHYTAGAEMTADELAWPPPPTEVSYDDLRSTVVVSFPSFGMYRNSTPDEDFEQESTVGDAVDDLADIVGELHEVAWRWQNTSERDAERHFRFGFESHWGRHLRDLQSYVHYRQFNR